MEGSSRLDIRMGLHDCSMGLHERLSVHYQASLVVPNVRRSSDVADSRIYGMLTLNNSTNTLAEEKSKIYPLVSHADDHAPSSDAMDL